MDSITRNLILIGLLALTLAYIVNGQQRQVPRPVARNVPRHDRQGRRICDTDDDCEIVGGAR